MLTTAVPSTYLMAKTAVPSTYLMLPIAL